MEEYFEEDTLKGSFHVLGSKIYKDGKHKFTVSTIDRRSSAFGYGNMRYLETMAFTVKEGGELDEIIYQGEGFHSHIKAVEMLHKHGKIIDDEE